MWGNNRIREVEWRTAIVLVAALFALRGAAAAPPADTGVARPTVEWLQDAVVYEIFPRAFSKEGNFKGIVPQLDRLKELGVTVIWLMPIHPVGKLKAKGTLGSPYAVRDYDAVNPEYGTGDDLKQLVAAAHRRGMKVFIDIVINHTAWDSVLMAKHPEWFTHDASGNIIPPNPDWVDVADLDWSQPGLRQYMTEMLVRWLREYDLDGFRCDYASGVPTDFWEALRPELDKVRPGLA
ncbi:MAG TPA: alpha-amylase family glycosyl hydrolase, partial [Steroidobacteraceae bacterium]